ncbi:cation:proton antiporter, partial [Candidatus Omnitrophota bacterium]
MNTVFALGIILFFGLVLPQLIQRVRIPFTSLKLALPSVTVYLLLGILIGPSLLDLIPKQIMGASGLVADIVLGIIAFSLGQNFTRQLITRLGRPVMWISIIEAVAPWILVTMGLFIFLKVPLFVAILFGAISSATAPAATVMVVRETKAKGNFTDTLLGVVAIDDAWCLIIFAVSLVIAKAISAQMAANALLVRVALGSVLEIAGSFLLGTILVRLFVKFSGFARSSTELLTYTLALVLLMAGMSKLMHLSILLTCMWGGATLVNYEQASSKFFDSIRSVDSILYTFFFVLAGANLNLAHLPQLGLIGLAYIVLRAVGKIGGSLIGGHAVKADSAVRKYLGLGLMPQAGVALGVALVAKSQFSNYWGNLISTTIVASTIIYELIGPLCTKFALVKAGDVPTEGR